MGFLSIDSPSKRLISDIARDDVSNQIENLPPLGLEKKDSLGIFSKLLASKRTINLKCEASNSLHPNFNPYSKRLYTSRDN